MRLNTFLAALVTLSSESLSRSAQYLTSRNVPVPTGTDLDCHLSPDLVEEIRNHSHAVGLIADLVLRGAEKHRTYDMLAEFVDTFGARPVGSQALDDAIDHLVDRLTQEELDNVHTEPVDVKVWRRLEERAWMVRPFRKKLSILALGNSVSTPPEGLTAEAVVVRDFQELEEKKEQVLGKIVIYNYNFTSYATGFQYRSHGATRASALGAVAALVRSATDFSLDTPHTGDQKYGNCTPIPVASITIEDAEMFDRMNVRGQRIVIDLKIETETLNDTVSRNTVAELVGTQYPEQLVIVGGHVDSWDVGQGAMDDGGGVFVSWRALSLLKRLSLKPKRTLRTVLWTAEEVGLVGALQYYQQHKAEQDNISIALEADYGTFNPLGLAMAHTSNETLCIVREVLTLFQDINNATLLIQEKEGPDLLYWRKDGVPTASILTANHRYFHYHHSQADTMTILDPDQLDLCTAFWTGLTYVLANLERPLPRT